MPEHWCPGTTIPEEYYFRRDHAGPVVVLRRDHARELSYSDAIAPEYQHSGMIMPEYYYFQCDHVGVVVLRCDQGGVVVLRRDHAGVVVLRHGHAGVLLLVVLDSGTDMPEYCYFRFILLQ